jgi:hypothetical protein
MTRPTGTELAAMSDADFAAWVRSEMPRGEMAAYDPWPPETGPSGPEPGGVASTAIRAVLGRPSRVLRRRIGHWLSRLCGLAVGRVRRHG